MARLRVDLTHRVLQRPDSALALIVFAGLVLRVVYVLANAGRQVTGDGLEYYHSALLLAEGKGFIRPLEYVLSVGNLVVPTAQHPPGWTVALAPVSLLGMEGLVAHQLWACVIGAATVGVVGLTGRRLAGPRAGLIAAAIAAFYPNLWMYERVLLSETLALLLAAVCLFVAYGFRSRPSGSAAAALGFVCGLLALTRPEAVLLVGLLVVPLVWLVRDADRRTRATWLGLAVAVALATMAPWAIYNSARLEHPVFLTTSLGWTLVAANCDEVYYGSHIGWWNYECAAGQLESVGDVEDTSSLDLELRRRAIDYVQDHIDVVPAVVIAREGRTWGLFQPVQQAKFDSIGGPTLDINLLGMGAYWLLMAAAVAGAIVLRRRRVPLFPLLAFAATVSIAVALLMGQTRYRALAEVPIVLLAAVAIDSWLRSPNRDGAVHAPLVELSPSQPREPVGV